MVLAANAYQKYQTSQVKTSRPEELTLLLYNELIRSVGAARKSLENGVYDAAHNEIIHAQEVISEFMATLDFNYEIANQLSLMYDFWSTQLIEANISKNPKTLRDIEPLIVDLRDTWAQAINSMRSKGN